MMEAISRYSNEMEKKYSDKFEAVLDNISDKFTQSAREALVESADRKADEVPMQILKSIVASLEAVGLPLTEETKKLQRELKTKDFKLQEALKDRNKLEQTLVDIEKVNRAISLVSGFNPSIVQQVEEWAKTRDISEITPKGIEEFLSGSTVVEQQRDYNLVDTVSDVLDRSNGDRLAGGFGISRTMPAMESVDLKSKQDAKLEALSKLSKGTARPKAVLSPNVSQDALIESETAVLMGEGVDSDVKHAMELTAQMGIKWGG